MNLDDSEVGTRTVWMSGRIVESWTRQGMKQEEQGRVLRGTGVVYRVSRDELF